MTPIARWPLLALILWSVGAGIVLAILFRWTSNQKAIGRAADRSRAELLAINLFQDDLLGVFQSFGRLLGYSVLRIGHSLPALLVIIGPLILLLSQLAGWYEWRPLGSGESVVIELQIDRQHWRQAQNARLSPPQHASVEAGPMRDVGQYAVFWKIRARPLSQYESPFERLEWDVGGQTFHKQLAISADPERLSSVSPKRSAGNWWERILYPLEDGLPSGSPVRGIEIHYLQRSTPIFGWPVPWWLTFLIVSMIAAFAVKPFIGVRF